MRRVDPDFLVMLHPDELRSALVLTSLYVLAYESFCDGIIDHLRVLFSNRIDEHGWHVDQDEYQRAVLSRDKNPLKASLLWFQAHGAIDAEEIAILERVRGVRNRLVHELSSLLGTEELPNSLSAFADLLRIYRKLETWRVLNLDMAGDPDWEGRDIDPEEVMPGPILMLQMLFDVALGNDDEAWKWYNAFREASKPDGTSGGSAI